MMKPVFNKFQLLLLWNYATQLYTTGQEIKFLTIIMVIHNVHWTVEFTVYCSIWQLLYHIFHTTSSISCNSFITTVIIWNKIFPKKTFLFHCIFLPAALIICSKRTQYMFIFDRILMFISASTQIPLQFLEGQLAIMNSNENVFKNLHENTDW